MDHGLNRVSLSSHGDTLNMDLLSSQRRYHSTGKPMCPARELAFLRSTPAPGDLFEQQAGLSPMWSHCVVLLMPFMLSLPQPSPSNVHISKSLGHIRLNLPVLRNFHHVCSLKSRFYAGELVTHKVRYSDKSRISRNTSTLHSHIIHISTAHHS